MFWKTPLARLKFFIYGHGLNKEDEKKAYDKLRADADKNSRNPNQGKKVVKEMSFQDLINKGGL